MLLPAFFIADLVEKKKISKTFLACCLPALGLAAAQWLTLHSDAVYAGQARELFSHASLLTTVAGNLLGYAERFALLFENGFVPLLPVLLLAVTASLGAAGFARRAGREPLLAAYAVLNILLLLAFPAADGLRYAFPLVPFLFYYAAAGWEEYSLKFGRAARYIAPALLLAVALSCVGAYSMAQYGGFREGTEKTETKQLFEFMRREVPEGSTVIFRKPRTLALYAGRRASMYHFGADGELLEYFRSAGAGYLITGSVFPEDRAFLIPFVERNGGRFSGVYSNPDFRVYKIR